MSGKYTRRSVWFFFFVLCACVRAVAIYSLEYPDDYTTRVDDYTTRVDIYKDGQGMFGVLETIEPELEQN